MRDDVVAWGTGQMFFKNPRRNPRIDPELERLPAGGDDESSEGEAPAVVLALEARIARLEAVRDALIAQIEDARRQWDAECRLREKQRREEQGYLAHYAEADRRRHQEQLEAERRAIQEQAEAERRDRLEQAEAERQAREELQRKVAALEVELGRALELEAGRQAQEEPGRPPEKAEPERPRALEIVRPSLARASAPGDLAARTLPVRLNESRPAADGDELVPAGRPAAAPGTWREEIAHKLKKINSRLEKQFDDFKQFNDSEALDALRRADDLPHADGIKRAIP